MIQVPQSLLAQLAKGGRMILPVGADAQRLILIEHTDQGFEQREGEAVRFVPLVPGLSSG